jgi:hypothetical protein
LAPGIFEELTVEPIPTISEYLPNIKNGPFDFLKSEFKEAVTRHMAYHIKREGY